MVGGRKVWYAQWWEDGSHRAKVIGPCSEITKSQAQAQLAAILAPINQGLTASAGRVVSFGEFVEKQFLPWQELAWKESTAVTTAQRINSLILPVFRHRLLKSISREELQRFLVHRAQTHSKSVVSHLRWDLNAIFNLANSDGLLLFNPAAELRVPRRCKEGRTKRALTEEEVVAYLAALELPERLMARLAIFEGMRPGEIYSLRWRDLSADAAAVERRIYQGVLDTPKNNRSRSAALSSGTAGLVNQWRELCPTPHPDAWVFPSATLRTPLRADNNWKNRFRPALEKINLEWASWQALRKTNATLMHKYGIDPKAGADQRGHGLGVSLAVYTESDLARKQCAVELLDQAIRRFREDSEDRRKVAGS